MYVKNVSTPRMTPRRLTTTAYHEAGHAVMAVLLRQRLIEVSIIPDTRKGSSGHCRLVKPRWFTPNLEDEDTPRRRNIAESFAMVHMAGEMAERKFNGRTRRADSRFDRENASDLVVDLARGCSDCGRFYKAFLRHRTQDAIESCWYHVECVAAALLERSRLTHKEVKAVMHAENRRRRVDSLTKCGRPDLI
jgi:Peptidase family M41